VLTKAKLETWFTHSSYDSLLIDKNFCIWITLSSFS
jgi:hypothetical protein